MHRHVLTESGASNKRFGNIMQKKRKSVFLYQNGLLGYSILLQVCRFGMCPRGYTSLDAWGNESCVNQ